MIVFNKQHQTSVKADGEYLIITQTDPETFTNQSIAISIENVPRLLDVLEDMVAVKLCKEEGL